MIITAVFRYLAMLRSVGTQKWLFDEVQDWLNECELHVNANQQWRRSDIDELCFRLRRYPLQHVLTARRQLTKYSAEEIKDLLELLTPERCKVFVPERFVTKFDGRAKGTQYCTSCKRELDECAEYRLEKFQPQLLAVCSADWPSTECEIDARFQRPKPSPMRLVEMTKNLLLNQVVGCKSLAERQSSSLNVASFVVRRTDSQGSLLPYLDRSVELSNGVQAYLISQNSFGGIFNHNGSVLTISIGVGHLQDPPDCRGLARLCQRLAISRKTLKLKSIYNEKMRVFEAHTEYSVCMGGFTEMPVILEQLAADILRPEFSRYEIGRALMRGMPDSPTDCIQPVERLQRCAGNPNHQFNRLPDERLITNWTEEKLLDQLTQFHSLYYSGNLVRLVVEDSRSLDDLEALVLATFGQLPDAFANRILFGTHPFDGTKMGVKIRSRGVNLDEIRFVFPVPDQSDLFETSPDLYVSYLFETLFGKLSDAYSRQRGELPEILRRCPVANLLDYGYTGFDSYQISFNTTFCQKNCSAEMEDETIKFVFRLIALIRKIGPKKWLHDEIRHQRRTKLAKNFEDILYRRANIINVLDENLSVASRLLRFPIHKLIFAGYLLNEYSPRAIEDFLTCLSPEKCKVFVSDLNRKGEASNEPSSQAKDASPHSEEEFSPELLAACSAPWPANDCELEKEFEMPEPNPFVCTDFSLKPREEPHGAGPRQLQLPSSCNARLWFCQDPYLNSRQVFIAINLVAPELLSQDAPVVLYDLLETLVSSFILPACESKSDFERSNQKWVPIVNSHSGISTFFVGYLEPVLRLLPDALSGMSRFSISSLNESHNNSNSSSDSSSSSSPDSAGLFRPSPGTEFASKFDAMDFLADAEVVARQLDLAGFICFSNSYKVQSVDLTDDVEVKDLEFVWSHFSKFDRESDVNGTPLFADIMVFGNATEADAARVAQTILAAMPVLTSKSTAQSPPSPQSIRKSERLLPKGIRNKVVLDVKEDVNENFSACAIVLQISTSEAWKASLCCQSVDESSKRIWHELIIRLIVRFMEFKVNPCKSDIIVADAKIGRYACCIVLASVQSKHPADIEQQLELFISKSCDYIEEKSSKSMISYERNVKRDTLQSICPTKFQEQACAHWNHIVSGDYDFSDACSVVKCIDQIWKKIDKIELSRYCRRWLSKDAADRRQLVVHKINREKFPKDSTNDSDTAKPDIFAELNKFKRCMESCPMSDSDLNKS
ncbi:hypothetical protein BOX15_Mlig021631g2 [Macrostomum lignano]|uniref:Uncharacterized protein n=1 Tax=Macrostomum lignano TaxID=282301 RepID=A0A267DIR2_9PLAT|nr:hypothetical protein BOX15_Mlig021631g2 [Macrostomum lignano]